MACSLKNNLSVPMYQTTGGKVASVVTGYDVVGLWGQSNMVGRGAWVTGTGGDNDYTAITAKTQQYGYTSQSLLSVSNPLDFVDETANTNGLWLNFSRSYMNKLQSNRKLLLQPGAQGGTSFSANNWNPGNTLYESCLTRLNAAMTQGSGYNVLKAILWLQGESDADAGSTAAGLYLSKIQAMYNDMVTRVTGMTSSTRFIVGSIKPDKPNASIINAALQSFVVANSAARYVDLTDLTFFDANHYTSPSLNIAGLRYAQVL